jgi:hypothetical protein
MKTPRHTSQDWEVYLPTILLVAIASIQSFLVNFYDLTPSNGGGFAMFSSSKYQSWRLLEIQLTYENDTYYVLDRSLTTDIYQRLRAMSRQPTEYELIDVIIKTHWYLNKKTKTAIPIGRDSGVIVNKFSLKIYEIRHSVQEKRINKILVRQVISRLM